MPFGSVSETHWLTCDGTHFPPQARENAAGPPAWATHSRMFRVRLTFASITGMVARAASARNSQNGIDRP